MALFLSKVSFGLTTRCTQNTEKVPQIDMLRKVDACRPWNLQEAPLTEGNGEGRGKGIFCREENYRIKKMIQRIEIK